jgi:hypothetical protein
MKGICPNINLPEWQQLVNLYDKDTALVVFDQLGGRVPSKGEVELLSNDGKLTPSHNQRSWDAVRAKGLINEKTWRTENKLRTVDPNYYSKKTAEDMLLPLNKEYHNKGITFFIDAAHSVVENGKRRYPIKATDNQFVGDLNDLRELHISRNIDRNALETERVLRDAEAQISIDNEGNITPRTQYQLLTKGEMKPLERSIRDIGSSASDRIGIPVWYINDVRKEWRGKYHNGEVTVNLAHATKDTPIHEILGHPIMRAIAKTNPTLWVNLRKELRTTATGREVLGRIQSTYEYIDRPKYENFEWGNKRYSVVGGFRTVDSRHMVTQEFEADPIAVAPDGTLLYTTGTQEISDKEYDLIYAAALEESRVTPEEQEEEAIVELLGMLTANKLDKVKNRNLITFLRELLKEIRTVVKELLGARAIRIDETLAKDLTLDEIATVLAYSNSKLILPGFEIRYTTPDNLVFSTWGEASRHVTELGKRIEDINLEEVRLEKPLSKEEQIQVALLEDKIKVLNNYMTSPEYLEEKEEKLRGKMKEISDLIVETVPFGKRTDIYLPSHGQPYDYVRLRQNHWNKLVHDFDEDTTTESLTEEKRTLTGDQYDGFVIQRYNTTGDKGEETIKITDEEAKKLWDEHHGVPGNWAQPNHNQQQELYTLKEELHAIKNDAELRHRRERTKRLIDDIKDNQIQRFLDANLNYEKARIIIQKWIEANDIEYNPEEVYSRGQGFYSVIGAYSQVDLKLLLQNLLSHIEDIQKVGGEYVISAFTKPITKILTQLEGEGGRVRFVISPKSKDIKWAADTDAYSGSVLDASRYVAKGKKSELVGVSYTKYPSQEYISNVRPNLADIIDQIKHNHNELGIALTSSNFRLEYDEATPIAVKKLVDSINSILDSKYGKITPPSIPVESTNPVAPKKTLDNLKQGIQESGMNFDVFYAKETNAKGNNIFYDENYLTQDEAWSVAHPDLADETSDFLGQVEMPTTEEIERRKKVSTRYNPEPLHIQALVNMKVAILKEKGKRQYPRSLIRSEVVKEKTGAIEEGYLEDDGEDWQKLLPSQEQESRKLKDIQTEKETKEGLKAKLDVLRKAIPQVEFVIEDERIMTIAVTEAGGKVIRINPRLMTTDSIGHEYGHVLIDMLGGMSNAMIKQGREQLRGTEIERAVMAAYPDLVASSDERLDKEILTTAVGLKTAEIFKEQELQNKWLRWVLRFMRRLRAMVGIESSVVLKLANQLVSGEQLHTKAKATTSERSSGMFIQGTPSRYDQHSKKLGDTMSLLDEMLVKQEKFQEEAAKALQKKLDIR